MSTSVVDASIRTVELDADFLRVTLRDGRILAAPIAWFPRLRDADDAERADWRVIGRGEGIHWDSLDEDVSVAGLLRMR